MISTGYCSADTIQAYFPAYGRAAGAVTLISSQPFGLAERGAPCTEIQTGKV
jgi:hypothetical protein